MLSLDEVYIQFLHIFRTLQIWSNIVYSNVENVELIKLQEL